MSEGVSEREGEGERGEEEKEREYVCVCVCVCMIDGVRVSFLNALHVSSL